MIRHAYAYCAATLLLPAATTLADRPRPPEPPKPPQIKYPHVNTAVGYRVDPTWPKEPSKYLWEAMAATAVDRDGLVWTLNRGEMPIQVYDSDGKLVREWGKGKFVSGHQLRFGPQGHVWVADSHAHAVYKFTPEGKLLLTIGKPNEPGEDETHFKMPTDVVETPAGDVFISDGYRNNRVVHCDATGKFVTQWGELGSLPGQFSLPHAIAMDSNGRLYVADRNNGRVQIFDQNGKFLDEWRNLAVPWTVRITPNDEVYVCGSSPSQWSAETMQLSIPPKDQVVMKLNTEGRVLSWWSFPLGPNDDPRPGELAWVHGLSVDADGNLYLGDIQGRRVQKFVLVPAGPGD
jgi:DNA-binding beta-propeller fold protein YncE